MTKEKVKNIVRHVFHFYEVNAENCNWTDMNEACGEILKALDYNLTVDWDELKRKILMEVDGGTDDKWLRYTDVCDNISNSIDDFKADLRGDDNADSD